MAEESTFASRLDNKRKLDDEDGAGAPPARRQTGFSAPVGSPQPEALSSYNSVPPPPDGIQLAKQRAQEIAAKLFSEAEAKRPKVDNGAGGDDSNDKGFSYGLADQPHKPLGQSLPSHVGTGFSGSFPAYGYQGSSKKIDIPNGRVGVIIGKGGETIKYLQLQSGAKIQVTRDADADPTSQTRLVELVGTPEQISKAEQLINDVLAEADIGGSGTLSARRIGASQAGGEQFVMKVPNSKVGLIIGKGGETIKGMQLQSGARIQLIPLHPPPGDTSTERTVQIDGTTEQIESAKQLVMEIVNSENRVRNPSMGGGYSQQGYQPPRPPTSWGPPGPPAMQQPGYGYMQPGAYSGQPPQYNMSQPPYGGYPPPPASGRFSSGWDQTANPQAQQTTPAGGYDYYNQQQTQQQQQQPISDGYGQQQPSSYNSQGSYGDSAYTQSTGGQQQNYSQDNYSGGYPASAPQPGYSQPASNAQSGYDHQQGYSSAPAYGGVMPTTADGSATAYSSHSGPTQVPQQASQPGYPGQLSSTPGNYPSQAIPQPGYGMPASSQPGYGSQPPAATAYGQLIQPTYGQSPQGQKPLPAQAVYGQAQQPPASQAGYASPAPVQPGYSQGQQPSTPSAFGPGGPQAGYGQQQPYGGPPPQGQPGYGQQPQQPYGDSYGGGGTTQPAVYSNESVHGAYDAPASGQSVPSGVTKASPKN